MGPFELPSQECYFVYCQILVDVELLAHRVYIKPIRHSDIRAVNRCCTITETISVNDWVSGNTVTANRCM